MCSYCLLFCLYIWIYIYIYMYISKCIVIYYTSKRTQKLPIASPCEGNPLLITTDQWLIKRFPILTSLWIASILLLVSKKHTYSCVFPDTQLRKQRPRMRFNIFRQIVCIYCAWDWNNELGHILGIVIWTRIAISSVIYLCTPRS